MSSAQRSTDPPAPGPLERITVLARRGQAAYRQRAAAVRAWLRQRLSASSAEEGSAQAVGWLRQLFAQHHLRERHEAYRKAAGPEPGTPDYVRNRLAQIERTKDETQSTQGTQSR